MFIEVGSSETDQLWLFVLDRFKTISSETDQVGLALKSVPDRSRVVIWIDLSQTILLLDWIVERVNSDRHAGKCFSVRDQPGLFRTEDRFENKLFIPISIHIWSLSEAEPICFSENRRQRHTAYTVEGPNCVGCPSLHALSGYQTIFEKSDQASFVAVLWSNWGRISKRYTWSALYRTGVKGTISKDILLVFQVLVVLTTGQQNRIHILWAGERWSQFAKFMFQRITEDTRKRKECGNKIQIFTTKLSSYFTIKFMIIKAR